MEEKPCLIAVAATNVYSFMLPNLKEKTISNKEIPTEPAKNRNKESSAFNIPAFPLEVWLITSLILDTKKQATPAPKITKAMQMKIEW